MDSARLANAQRVEGVLPLFSSKSVFPFSVFGFKITSAFLATFKIALSELDPLVWHDRRRAALRFLWLILSAKNFGRAASGDQNIIIAAKQIAAPGCLQLHSFLASLITDFILIVMLKIVLSVSHGKQMKENAEIWTQSTVEIDRTLFCYSFRVTKEPK
jgi:hypothetical protein